MCFVAQGRLPTVQMVKLTQQRGDEILRRMPLGRIVGVEVGVWDGRLSQYLLDARQDLTLYMVDRWRAVPPCHSYYRSESLMARSTQETFDEVYQKACDCTSHARDRGIICRGESADWAHELRDTVFDFAFIDAEHTYTGVRNDIAAWQRLVRPDGWVCGHDWDHPDHKETWGVRHAVEEYAKKHDRQIELGRNRTWFVLQTPQLSPA